MLGFNGGLMGVRRTPTTGAASGLWFQNEQSVAQRAGIWPIVQAGDPNFANVSLLLHMDGSNGSTTFTDSSSNAFTVTANGNAQISTAQSKFGGASGLFDGTNDSVSAPSASAPSGTEDFTIESWIQPITTPGAGTYLGICALGNTLFNNVFYLFVPSTPGQFAILWNNGGRKAQSADVVNVNQWHHVAITRQSNLFRTFVDGVTSVDTWTNSDSIPAEVLRVGSNGSGSESFNGYIDDLRITKGIARYTANFTPPTAPFPNA
jgi:hypothetical protein